MLMVNKDYQNCTVLRHTTTRWIRSDDQPIPHVVFLARTPFSPPLRNKHRKTTKVTFPSTSYEFLRHVNADLIDWRSV